MSRFSSCFCSALASAIIFSYPVVYFYQSEDISVLVFAKVQDYLIIVIIIILLQGDFYSALGREGDEAGISTSVCSMRVY